MKRYENQKWKQSMRLRLDFNNMMSDMLGEEQGISKIDRCNGRKTDRSCKGHGNQTR